MVTGLKYLFVGMCAGLSAWGQPVAWLHNESRKPWYLTVRKGGAVVGLRMAQAGEPPKTAVVLKPPRIGPFNGNCFYFKEDSFGLRERDWGPRPFQTKALAETYQEGLWYWRRFGLCNGESAELR